MLDKDQETHPKGDLPLQDSWHRGQWKELEARWRSGLKGNAVSYSTANHHSWLLEEPEEYTEN